VAPRVLVVQSRPEVARAVSIALADADLEAVVLADGHAVLATVAAWHPHVVLVDLSLPALDGWYVLASLGALESRPLIVARVTEAADVDRAIALGADAWVDADVHVVAAAGRLVPSLAA
jgi:two-component system, OmpR family, KDP operon response regulator KdpE